MPSPGLRRFILIGTEVEDPRIAPLAGEMSLAGEPFRRPWARQDVRALAGAPTRMCHPQAGMLELRREKPPPGDSGGQLVVIYHAEPDSAGGRSLALRGSLASADEAAAVAGGGREPRISARGSFAPLSAGRDSAGSGANEHILITNRPFRLMSAC